ncbi:hypothetical protein HCDG_03652 [Histoplasma capsulatum H143]|uniref:Uncharacterized protein n=1 Tax=Ajellomyces capsulatus (strain H143) TaxID=544712 RepID=C6HCA3_AJECH|nr:hypothetical protein HCDG_03652 [Histoplasma capsulatum H143]
MTDGITHSEKEPYFYSRLETRAVESVWGRLECPAEGFEEKRWWVERCVKP